MRNAPMETPKPPLDSDFYFQEIVRKLPSLGHPEKLAELSKLALAMLLRRASSRHLRLELENRIDAIIGKIADRSPPEEHRLAMRRAALDCVKVLEEAKARRLSRSAQAADEARRHPAGRPPHSEAGETPRATNYAVWGIVGVLLLAVIGGGFFEWKRRSADEYDPSATVKFVDQILEAAQGHPQPTHLFGGSLELSSMNGLPVVIAKGVPPKACAASGMRLVRKGILGINGETPQRISSAIITELCYKDPAAATIMWSPKDVKP